MTIAINLLISAMTLLTMIQQNPNLPQSFRDSAISIANQAITVAQDEIANQNKTATNPVVINNVTPVQTVQQPVFSGIIPSMNKEISISANPLGEFSGKYHYVIRVTYTENGITPRDIPVNISTNDTGAFEFRDLTLPEEQQNGGLTSGSVTINTKKVGDEIISYVVYRANSKPFTITATANGVTKDLNVQ